MKQLRKGIRVLAFIIVLLFATLAGYGAYSLVSNGGRWFASSANSFVYAEKKKITPGDILDRNGVVLATTVNGVRTYQADTASRSAVVHVVGDIASNVANGVESFMAYYLYGFNASYFERLALAVKGAERVGDDVMVTIDSKLSIYIAKNFPAGSPGAVVVMNYITGEVLSMQSFPVFDPKNVTSSVLNDLDKPFWNRATKWSSAPGSTFKIITLASALQNLPAVTTKNFKCTGRLADLERPITDAGNAVHDDLDLLSAFSKSCNNTFANLALELTDPLLKKTAEGFGFNDNFLFRDLVVENSIYPSADRTSTELAWTGVGQSTLMTTPLHMCMIASGIANEGVMMEPRLLFLARNSAGQTRVEFSSKIYRKAVGIKDAATINEYMRSAIKYGTGTAAAVQGLDICGKTGTAEIDGQQYPNAWFVGYINSGESPYAVCVVVENAEKVGGEEGSGGSVAAPLAKLIFKYLAGK